MFVFRRAERDWNGGTLATEPIASPTVLRFDADTGALLSSFGGGAFAMPHGLTVDAAGHLWLTDVALHQVFELDEAGNILFTKQQILDGQEQFLTYGLMQFGTVYGHGAYLGPDFTADYLHRMALHMNKRYGDDEAPRGRTTRELQANRYDPQTGTLVWTAGQVSAFEEGVHVVMRLR